MCLLAIATPAAFRASPNATAAANVVGAMLTPWHYVAIAAPLLLLLLRSKDSRGPLSSTLLFVALIFAASEAMIDLRIRAIRTESPVAISSLRRDDPVRRRFGLLHGVSSLLLLGQVVISAIVVGRNDG